MGVKRAMLQKMTGIVALGTAFAICTGASCESKGTPQTASLKEKETVGAPPRAATTASETPDQGPDLVEGVAAAETEAQRRAMAVLAELKPTFKVDPKTRQLLIERKWKAGFKRFEAAPPRRPELIYAHGYTAYQAEEHGRALELLESVSGKLPLLENDRRYYAARAAAGAEKPRLALKLAEKVPKKSVFADDVLYLSGELQLGLEESASKEAGRATLAKYIARFGRSRRAVEAQFMLAEDARARGAHDEAARRYQWIVTRHPLSKREAEANKALKELEAKLSDKQRRAFASGATERLLARAQRLYKKHRSKEVIAALEKSQASWKGARAKDERCEALFLVAMSWTKLRKHDTSADWYRKLLKDCPKSEHRRRAMYKLGRGLWNINKRKEAREVFKQIWTEYADHSYADDAMHFTGRSYVEENRIKRARKMFLEQVEKYPKGDMAADAHWYQLRFMWEAKDYKGIIKYVDKIKDPNERDLYTEGRMQYFKARALEKLGKKKKASAIYESVARRYPLGFYALLAVNRLGRLGGATKKNRDLCELKKLKLCEKLEPEKKEPVEIEIPEDIKRDVSFRRGMLLLHMGLQDQAEDDFRRLRRRHSKDRAKLWALALLLHASGTEHLSHNIARRRIWGWKTSYPPSEGGDRLRWEIAYPRPYHAWVKAWSKKRGLPEALVYAIMREESGFNPRIESWANARGLLQLMESTATDAAKRDGYKKAITAERLFDPRTNIRLATAYFEWLSERFDGQPAMIAPGYNAGGSKVSEWLVEFGDKPVDVFIESIPYSQTRGYSKRVLNSFWTYSWLYGEEKVPWIEWELPKIKKIDKEMEKKK